MNKCILATCMLFVFGCANTTFHQVSLDDDQQSLSVGDENTGLIYYPPKLYVLVTRPLNKDGATTTKVVSLPDKSKPMSMKFRPGFGSATVGVTLSNGIVTSFNQTVDPQIDELLANLAAPVTGFATADATKATAGLTSAQEAQIRAQIANAAAEAEAEADAENESGQENNEAPPNPCSENPSDWIDFVSDTNGRLSSEQVSKLKRSMNGFACSSLQARKLGKSEAAHSLDNSVEIIRLVATEKYLTESHAVLPLMALGKDPVAEPLRLAAKEFKEVKFEPEADQTNILAGSIRQSAQAILAIANELDPPKAAKKSPPPFELYEIVTRSNGSVSLRKVDEMSHEIAAPVGFIEE